jgi:SAM-dependent methyltransferase
LGPWAARSQYRRSLDRLPDVHETDPRQYDPRRFMFSDEHSDSTEAHSRYGGAFYDQPGAFERYRAHRAWPLNPNITLEEPAFQGEVGAVSGLRVLDLGCGDGETGTALLAAGGASYLGVDSSTLMVEGANAKLAGSNGRAVLGNIDDFETQPAAFDLIVSRMAMHYLQNISEVLCACHHGLTNGRLVFTVTHPVITSHDCRESTTERRQDWLVDNYFVEGSRPQVWLGADSVWYHRTIETYVTELRGAGFTLTNLRECVPRRDLFNDEAEFQRRQRIPLMLLISGTRS